MRQLTRIKHISLRFAFTMESDIDWFKITLKCRKTGEIITFEHESFGCALIDAHRHFKEPMKQDIMDNKAQKRFHIY